MLQYFRINDPYRLVALLLILAVVYLPLFLDPPPLLTPELKSWIIGEKIAEGNSSYSELVTTSGPITNWFYALLQLIFERSVLARHIIAFFMIFLYSAFLGIMFIDKKVFSESTYLPPLICSFLFFFSFDTVALTGELLGAGLLFLALSKLFREMEFRNQRDETVLSLGILISLASLCYFPYGLYVIAACISLVFYARKTLKGFLLLLIGFFLPHALLASIYYLYDDVGTLWEYFYLGNMAWTWNASINVGGLITLGAIPVFFLLAGLVMLNRESRLSKYQSQVMQTMFLWMIFGAVQIFLSRDVRPQHFITVIPPLTYFICHFLLAIRRRRLAEINLWVFILGIAGVTFLSRYNILPVNYSELRVAENAYPSVQNKRVLVLGESISVYRENYLATPFFNWNLSKNIFENPGYYEHVIRVNEAIKQDPPDVIIDENNYTEAFMERIPSLKELYRKEGKNLYRKRTEAP